MAQPALLPEQLEAMTAILGGRDVLGGDADRITVLFDLYGYRTLDVDAVGDDDLLDVRDVTLGSGNPSPLR